jgi:hypothetical protein
MLRIRFVCVAAATLSIASVAATGGANAQSASTDPSTTPSLLTQLFSQPSTTPAPASTAPAPVGTAAPPVQTKPRRVASRRHRAYSKQATNQHGDRSANTAQSNASADAWLAASAPPANATSTNSAAADPAQQDTAPSASAASPGSVVVDGQTVQIAKADQVNDIDLAANSAAANVPAGAAPANIALAANAPGDVTRGPTVQATMETTLPRGDRADMIGAAAVKAAQTDAAQTAFAVAAPAAPNAGGEAIADPGPSNAVAQDSGGQGINDQDAVAQDAGTQVSNTPTSGMFGGVAWIAQMLAALGGALTAGIVAWVLIGADPVRTYG